ncbi:MAG TPA: integrase [Afipia sp.]
MPLKLYKRGEVWHYRGTVAGRRLRGSTGATNKDIAARIAAELDAKTWKHRLDGPQAVLTFAQAAIQYRAAGKSTRFLEKIEDYWKDTLVKDITAGAIRASAIELCPKTTNATRNRQCIVTTQAIINHAAESNLCPYIRVKRFKVETKVKKPATLEWINAFCSQARQPYLGGLARFMFLTGARVSEALAVTWADVDLRAKTVLIKQTKIGAERRAHLPQPLIVAMANISKNTSRPVFFYLSRDDLVKSWRRVCRDAGIEALTPHSCRHGFATALLHKGIDPVTIAKLGGWKSARHVLETYGHASDDTTLTDLISGTPLTQPPKQNVRKPKKLATS